jgi:hypothetical protein
MRRELGSRAILIATVLVAALALGGSRELTLANGGPLRPTLTVQVYDPYGLSLSPNGSHMSVFNFTGSTFIWNVASGAYVGRLANIGSGATFFMTALLDDPCVGLSGNYREAPGPVVLVLFKCTGEILAKFENLVSADDVLGSAVAVPSCRLLVARLHERTVVVDAERRVVRAELSALFPKPLAMVAAAHKSCSVYAVQETDSKARPTRIFRIELDAGIRTEVATLVGDEGQNMYVRNERSFAVSPDDGAVAVETHQFDPGGTFVDVFDTRKRTSLRRRRVAPSTHDVESLSFLSAHELLVLENSQHFYTLDTRSGAVAPVRISTSKGFKYPYLAVYSGTSLAVVGDPSEVRVYNLPR